MTLINKPQRTSGSTAQWFSFPAKVQNNTTQNVNFFPANGLPLGSYQQFIDCFDGQFNFSGINCRGAWPNEPLPDKRFSWHDHADDLIAAIEKHHNEPVIGMGHSLGGAVTLLAAKKRPDLFSKLVIIEPATLPSPFVSKFYGHIPQWLSFKLFPFIRKTHNRQRLWASRDAFFDNYRQHPTYRSFTEQALTDYAQHGLVERDDGQFELLFNPAWESFNFRRVHYLWNALDGTTHPTLLLRAEHCYMYTQEQFEHRNKKLSSNITAKMIPNASHLVTHEMPKELSELITDWL